MLAAPLLAGVLAVSARWSFEDAYDNVDGGAWYLGQGALHWRASCSALAVRAR